MISEGVLSRLHDAELLSVDVEWRSGTVRLRIRTWGAWVTVTAEDFLDLQLPRQQPWGPSRYIMGASIIDRPKEGLGQRLEVEMQTGDCLVVDASTFEAEWTDVPGDRGTPPWQLPLG